ncbi:MAG: ABC transporter permease subunit [Bacillota bacterium]
MKRLNVPLLMGLVILLIILAVSLFPEEVVPTDPYGIQKLEYVMLSEKMVIAAPPIPPCKEFPWGTDRKGRDIRALLVYGCGQTIGLALLAAILRMFIALPLGIAAAYKSEVCKYIIKQFNVVFGAFPAVLAVVFLSKIGFIARNFETRSMLVAFLLVLLGWGKLAHHIMSKVEEILSSDFIEGEIAIGKSKLEIALQNVIPHLLSSVVVMFFLEAAIVLLNTVQVGILDAVATRQFYDDEGFVTTPDDFDWASMLRGANVFLAVRQYWIVLAPTIAFSLSIIGFNMLGEGLRMEFEKRTSKVITFIKGIPSYLSPLRFVYELKNFTQYKREIAIKLTACALVAVMLLFPKPQSKYVFSMEANAGDNIKNTSATVDRPEDAGIKISTFIDVFKKYGIQPLGSSYLQEINVDFAPSENEKVKLSLEDDNFRLRLEYIHDFALLKHNFSSVTLPLEVITAEVLLEMTPEDFKQSEDKALIADLRKSTYNSDDIVPLLEERLGNNCIIFIDKWDSKAGMQRYITSKYSTSLVITVFSDHGDDILKLSDNPRISIDSSNKTMDVNIIGCIPGTDEQLKNDFIVLGTNLHEFGRHSDKEKTPSKAALLGLELAKSMIQNGIKPKRTIVFAFWGGNGTSGRGTESFIRQYSFARVENLTYVEIGDLNAAEYGNIGLDATKTSARDQLGQSVIKCFKQLSKRYGMAYDRIKADSSTMRDFYAVGRAAIYFGSTEKEENKFDWLKADEEMNIEAYGRIILNTLAEISTM